MHKATAVSGDLQLTEIPQQFLLPKTKGPLPGTAACNARSQLRKTIRNKQYEKKLENNTAVRLVSHYRVPVNRPLSVKSLYVARPSHRKDFNVESSLAPLFGGSAGGAAAVSFLTPAEDNPRRAIEEKKKKEVRPRGIHYSKQVMNEPKHMPNLNKKVSKKFIPQCAMISTRSLAS